MTQNSKTNPKIRLSFLDPNGMARKGDFRLVYRKIILYLEEYLTHRYLKLQSSDMKPLRDGKSTHQQPQIFLLWKWSGFWNQMTGRWIF